MILAVNSPNRPKTLILLVYLFPRQFLEHQHRPLLFLFPLQVRLVVVVVMETLVVVVTRRVEVADKAEMTAMVMMIVMTIKMGTMAATTTETFAVTMEIATMAATTTEMMAMTMEIATMEILPVLPAPVSRHRAGPFLAILVA